MEIDFEHRLTKVEQAVKSDEHRLDELEEKQESLIELTSSVKVLAEKVNGSVATISRVEAKVDALAEKPAKRWDKVAEYVLLALVGAGVAYVLAHLGL